MTHNSFDEIKELIAYKLAPDEILDILGFTSHELVELLEEEIKENLQGFLEALD